MSENRSTIPAEEAETFAADLEEEAVERKRPEKPAEIEAEPLLDEAEVAAWMELFGPEPEIPARPRRRPKSPASGKEKTAEAAPRGADELKDSEGVLTEAEVAEWLALFDGETSQK